MTLTTEQVIAELHKARDEYERTLPGGSGALRLIELNGRMRELIDQLPRVDVVERCIRAGWETMGYGGDEISPSQRRCFKVSVRTYLELKGLPADPELEGK